MSGLFYFYGLCVLALIGGWFSAEFVSTGRTHAAVIAAVSMAAWVLVSRRWLVKT